MSRIHEALKRAELERANGRAASGNAGIAAAADVAVAVKAPPAGMMVASVEAPPARPEQYRFEDIVTRRQSHAEWNPDLATDVFDVEQGANGAEQFRTLRSRLYHLRNEQPVRTLLVTSSMAGEGKTFVTGNLVRSIARQHDRRVLVIDADLRAPRLHALFGAPTLPGLSDYLRGTIDETAIIQFGGTGNLCLISSGTHVNDPSELLSNGRMKILLERLAPAFDWVLIDSPPCLPVADAGVIANLCDGVLLVVRAGYTPSAVIARSRKELKGRNLVGVVLNAVEESSSSYGPYYGGYGTSSAKVAK